MSSSSSSSSSSSDSDDDESVKKLKKDKRLAKMVRREIRSKEEDIKDQKERERRSREVKHLEIKRKRDEYQRFLLEKQRNPNKEPMTMMIAKNKNDRIASRTAKKKPWYELSPPRSYIEHGERQTVTPSIKDWREMMSRKGGKRRNRTMKNRRVHS